MNRVFKAVRGIKELVKNPWLLNHVLNADQTWQAKVVKEHGFSNGLPVVSFSQLVDQLDESIAPLAFLDGSSLVTDLALLKTLAKTFTNCSYFEIGTWRGESVANVAQCAAECYTLNLSAKDIVNMGYSQKYADLHGFFSKGLPNVTHLEGNSKTFHFAGLNKKFDLIFIDGNHRYEFVKSDTEQVFKHLVHSDSIVVWHDYAYNPEQYRPEVMAGILDGLPPQYKERVYHVANTLCALYTPQNLPTVPFEKHMTPKTIFSVQLKAKTNG